MISAMDYFPWIYGIIALIPLCYLYFTWNFDYWEKRGVPGNKPRLFAGTLKPTWKYRFEEQEMENFLKFGRTYGGFDGTNPVLYTSDPELIKQVTVKDFSVFPTRRDFPGLSKHKYVRDMLTVLKGDEWKTVRSTLTPAFTRGKLKQMVCLIEDCVNALIRAMELKMEREESLELTDHFSVLTLDVIASCAFGMKIDSVQNSQSEFVLTAKKAFQMSPVISYLLYLFPKMFNYFPHFIFPNPFQYFADVANKAIEMRLQKNSPEGKDFLQIMLNAEIQETPANSLPSQSDEANLAGKATLTRDLIVAQIILFLLAGHETTSTTLSYLVYELAINPDVQETLIAEIDKVMTEYDGKLTYEAIEKMPYLDMVIFETLRVQPPGVKLERTCDKDGYKLNGITLSRGVVVSMPIYPLYNDPEFYPNPEVFDPERFSAENKVDRSPFLHISFGAGPRNCIGMRFALMEMKITLILILLKYRFQTSDKTQIPLKYHGDFGLRKPESVNLKLQKRHDQPQFSA